MYSSGLNGKTVWAVMQEVKQMDKGMNKTSNQKNHNQQNQQNNQNSQNQQNGQANNQNK